MLALLSAGRSAEVGDLLEPTIEAATALDAVASLFRSLVDLVAGQVREAEAEAANALRAAGDDHVWAAGFRACVAAIVDVLAVQGRTALAERVLEDHRLAGPLGDSVPYRVLLHSRGQLRRRPPRRRERAARRSRPRRSSRRVATGGASPKRAGGDGPATTSRRRDRRRRPHGKRAARGRPGRQRDDQS